MSPFRATVVRDEVLFDVRAVPRGGRDAVVGVIDGALKIAVTAPPVDGEANAAIVAFVAKTLGVPKARVRIAHGERSKRKTIAVQGVPLETVLALAPT